MNTQVAKLQSELRREMGQQAPIVRTRAGLYQMDNVARPRAEDMVEAMSEASIDRIERATTKLEDEYALGAPGRIDACQEADLLIRKGRPLSFVKFGDLFQGDPIINESELKIIPGSSVAPQEKFWCQVRWLVGLRWKLLCT